MNKIVNGDAIEVMTLLETNSVDAIITSPPYYNLRDYKAKGQRGKEDTVELYVNNLCDVFDEAKRVLKKTGVLWLNIGDTYKNKGLLMVPERLAIEMVKRGWMLRQEVIWEKPCPQPTSNKDRFWTNHEKVFMFVQNKNYYFEQPRVPQKEVSLKRYLHKNKPTNRKDAGKVGFGFNYENQTKHFEKMAAKIGDNFDYEELVASGRCPTRPLFSVWKMSTANTKGFHFATFPEKLVETPLLASVPEGGLVLDPFNGSGTTCLVAKKNKRNYIGIDINPDYCEKARKRLDETTISEGNNKDA